MMRIEPGEGLTVITENAGETQAFGRMLAEAGLCASDVIALSGPLGAGKTVFVKGLAEGLEVRRQDAVTSPTFVLLNKYLGRMPLYHFDAYRLRSPADMFEIGCDEIFYGSGVSVVEWADRVPECLPEERLSVGIEITGAASRRITVRPIGERWKPFVSSVRQRLAAIHAVGSQGDAP